MPDFELMIRNGKYREAAKALDAEMAKKEGDRLYYLRAIVSYKLKNYEYAMELVEHALFLKKEPDYLKLKGLMLMETLDFGAAFEMFSEVIQTRKDAEAYFLSSVCLMIMDDARSKDYLQLAYLSDRAKTKSMLNDFYADFFRNNRFIGEKEKRALEEKIRKVK